MSLSKILIVEDDHDVRLGYHILLTACRFETCLATDGLSAVSAALKHRPNLTILDIDLPAGDGFFVMARFRSNAGLSTMPVIVVSGLHDTRERAFTAGARAHFCKPWNDGELLTVISELLGLPAVSMPQSMRDLEVRSE